MMNLIRKISLLFDASDYRKIALFIFLAIIVAFAEMIGIGMIMPIINVLADPSVLEDSGYYSKAYALLGSDNPTQFITMMGCLLVFYLILKNAFIASVIFFQSRFICDSEAKLSTKLLRSYLNMPYEDYIKRNSSDLLRNINQEINHLFIQLVNASFMIATEMFVVMVLLGLLLFLYPLASITVIILGIISAYIFMVLIKKPLAKFGEKRVDARGRMLEWATQGLHGFKELVVANRKDYLANSFSKQAENVAKSSSLGMAMNNLPRMYIETIAIVILLVVIIQMTYSDQNFVQALSLFGLVTFRTLPSLNRIAASSARIRFYLPSLDIISRDLLLFQKTEISNQNFHEENALHEFSSEITLKNVHFKYPQSSVPVLKGINLEINKGDIISLTGESGAGKSTLLDIMLGLLKPESGEVLFDGKDIYKNIFAWRQNIAYLPQFVYLINGTIKENIAFGLNENDIDEDKLQKVILQAELKAMIDNLPNGIDSIIGDVSVKISGGQRQRIGIARALYYDRDILFLDEATASLDPATEERICNTLKSLTSEVTIISISHRKALSDIANKIYRLENGKLNPTNCH